MPNVIHPGDLPPYPWKLARLLVRLVGGLLIAGGVVHLLALGWLPELAWFNREPFLLAELPGWMLVWHYLQVVLLLVGGVGLVLLKAWGRWGAIAGGAIALIPSAYALVANTIARRTDWVWAGAAVGSILLSYAFATHLKPVFRKQRET